MQELQDNEYLYEKRCFSGYWQQLRATELDRVYTIASFHRSFQEPQAKPQCSCIINGSMSATI